MGVTLQHLGDVLLSRSNSRSGAHGGRTVVVGDSLMIPTERIFNNVVGSKVEFRSRDAIRLMLRSLKQFFVTRDENVASLDAVDRARTSPSVQRSFFDLGQRVKNTIPKIIFSPRIIFCRRFNNFVLSFRHNRRDADAAMMQYGTVQLALERKTSES